MKKPKGCRAWRRSRRAGRPEAAVVLEGRAPCRPIYAGRSPAPIRPTKPRLRAGKMGADGASPSRLSIGAPAPRSWYIGGTTFAMLASRFAFPAGPLRGASSALPSASVVSSDSRGAQPRPIPIKRVRAGAWKTTALTEQRPPWRSVPRHQINAFTSPWYGQSSALVTKLARTGFSTTYRHFSS